MLASPATARAAAAALAVAAALLVAPRPAGSTLLEQPPRRAAFKLDDPAAAEPELPLLDAFRDAAVERPGPMRMYLSGPWGRWRNQPWWSLAWGGADGAAEAPAMAFDPTVPFEPEPLLRFDPADRLDPAATLLRRIDPAAWSAPLFASTGPSLASNGLDVLWELPPKKPVRDWRCRRRPVQFVRYGGESDTFPLVRCDGSVAPEALDRVSIIARPPDAPDPGELLPDEPDAAAWEASLEWVPNVRVVQPRLLWLLQRIADAFPWRTIYVFSGYRPDPKHEAKKEGHHSKHAEGRAMDIVVMGIPNAALFKFCRTLDDVGCGFYPNSKFVHVDVRRPGTGRAFWVDASGPGEPSRYVDAWPGVVEGGAMVWSSSAQGAATAAP